MIKKLAIESREQWLEMRKSDVTASVVGALFDGVHPYATRLKLYAEKRGTEFVVEDNAAMRRGRWLEPAVGKAVAEMRPTWTLEPSKHYYRDEKLKIGATPDFLIHGDPRGLGVLQAKSVAPSVYSRDWNDGAEPPLWIILQAAQEAMLVDAAFVCIAALLVDAHAMDISIHEFPRNPAAEEKIKKAVAQFWKDVENGHEPDPDFSRDADTVRALWKREATPPIEVDLSGNNRVPDLLAERAALKIAIKNFDDRLDAIDTEIKFLMKDAAIATGIDGWRVTYRTSSFKEYTVKARETRVLRVTDQRKKEV